MASEASSHLTHVCLPSLFCTFDSAVATNLNGSDMDWCDGDDGLVAFKETLLGSDVNDLRIVVPTDAS